jgi:iron complex outermembrane receptor protein
MRHALLAVMAGFGLLSVSPSFAQTSPGPGAQTVSTGSDTQLQEVVVTAQRREETLQRAAVPVSVVTGDQLALAGVTQVEDLSKLVPSLQVAPAAGPYTLFYLRGVGNFNGNALSDAAVAFNVDGVYVARPSSTDGVFYDVDRVEVLNGPQGTLYGRNATAGAINVLTKEPDHILSAGGELEGGNFNDFRATGNANLPINDWIAVRGAFQVVSRSGYLDDGTDDDHTQSGRLKVRLDFSDNLKLIVGGDYTHVGGNGVGASLLSGSNQFVGGNAWLGNTSPAAGAVYARTLVFTAGNTLSSLPFDSQTSAHCDLYEQNHAGQGCPLNDNSVFQDNKYTGVYADLTWTTSAGTLTVVPAYRHADLDYMSAEAGFRIDQTETDNQTSLEARFASNADQPLRYLAGLYYLHEGIDSNPGYDQEYNYSSEHVDATTNTVAGFGRLTWAFTDSFRATGGFRYTWERKQADGSYLTMNTLCPGVFIPPPAGPEFCFGGVGQVNVPAPPINVNQSNTWDKVTWRGALEYDVSAESLLYASVETGFKSGGFSMSSTYPVYQPETITAYTLGSKNRFFDNRLQANLEIFDWDYKNQQISHLAYDTNGTLVFPTLNVGHSTIRGAEANIQWLATTSTLLGVDAQYLHSRYDNYNYGTPYFGAPPSSGCPYTVQPGPPALAVLNCSGMTPPQSPQWTINLNARQAVHIGSYKLVGTVDAHYQGETLTGLDFLPVEQQKSYWITDAYLSLESPSGHWTLTGFVRNLSNTSVLTASFLQPLAGTDLPNASVAPPRTYGAIVGFRF